MNLIFWPYPEIQAFWDGAVKRRAEGKSRVWQKLLELRGLLEES